MSHLGVTSEASRIFDQLCSPSPAARSSAASALTDLIEEKHSTGLHMRVGELIASAVPSERTGGLAAMGALLLIEGDDLGPRLSTYGAPLRTALQLSAATSLDALSILCNYYGELVVRARDPDALETEIRWALSALGGSEERGENGEDDEADVQALVGTLTLRQLTLHVPTSVYPHSAAALEQLWKPLTFDSAPVRSGASDALLALLVLVAPRASRYLTQWYTQLLAGARAALEREAASPASCHGGLLALSALLRVASVEFVFRDDGWEATSPTATGSHSTKQAVGSQAVFSVAWTAARRYLAHRRYPELTRTAMSVLIDLVRIAPTVFATRCLPDSMRVLGDILRDQRSRLRGDTFVTQAAIVDALGSGHMRPYVVQLLTSVSA